MCGIARACHVFPRALRSGEVISWDMVPRGFAVMLAIGASACGRVGFDSDPGDGSRDGASSNADADTDGATTRDAAPTPNVAFASSFTTMGNFGGIAVATAECQSLATAAHLPGTFVALLGDSTHTVESGIDGARGWVDTTGVPIADLPSAWLGGGLFHPLERDEHGALVPYTFVWIGGGNSSCGDWTMVGSNGISGDTRSLPDPFTYASCNAVSALACVQIDAVVPVVPTPVAGRKMFVTVNGFMPGGGLSAANALCDLEANGAGLPGTYAAVLATAGGDQFSQLSDGLPWTRVDGVAITPTAADFLAASGDLSSFVAMSAAGVGNSNSTIWIGSTTDNCSDWTATAGSGEVGDATSVMLGALYGDVATSCAQERALLCAEQ
jgi:hypothetical protein